jgi:GTPase KRas
MILYSVDEASTFDNAYAMRKKIERAKDLDTFPMVLVGNKCDKDNRQITSEQGAQKAAEMGCPYIETSAKSGVSRSPICIHFYVFN